MSADWEPETAADWAKLDAWINRQEVQREILDSAFAKQPCHPLTWPAILMFSLTCWGLFCGFWEMLK